MMLTVSLGKSLHVSHINFLIWKVGTAKSSGRKSGVHGAVGKSPGPGPFYNLLFGKCALKERGVKKGEMTITWALCVSVPYDMEVIRRCRGKVTLKRSCLVGCSQTEIHYCKTKEPQRQRLKNKKK